MPNEADTCRTLVVPALQAAGWDAPPHAIAEQRTVTDGRIVPAGPRFVRRPPKRVDYLLRYTRDLALAVVEAKASYRRAADGMQQAKDYAEMLGLRFAYATNGHEILEFDYTTGRERARPGFPAPAELWARYRAASGLTDEATAERALTPSHALAGKGERYYQQAAVTRVVEAVLTGQGRVLVTMATGTGKTLVAFQVCWRLWSAGWNRAGAPRSPRILYLADRHILVDQPKDGLFAAFGDARHKVEGGAVVQSREMYFALYQALAEDERRAGLFRQFAPNFFDLVVVDECHRGSAGEESTWRAVLEYFAPAAQFGMTATPLRADTRDTYAYFGAPVYEYSLRQGIADGFLAPYRVHRVVTDWDAAGWRPSASERDRFGRAVPDGEYGTGDFERVVALRARTEAIARHLTAFLRGTDRYAKTLVFCVDQEHASEMRQALAALNADLVARHPDWVCRVTADEGDVGRGHLARFQDVETRTPAVLTTSQLLTTGVDAPTVKNVVLARVVGSMSEFKQIIGRGTRVRDDYGKLWFNILDYTGSATRLFADPAFDGDPAGETVEHVDREGRPTAVDDETRRPYAPDHAPGDSGVTVVAPTVVDPPEPERRKYYVDGGRVEIAAHLVYELDPDGRQLRVVRYTDYAAGRVRTLAPNARALRARWADPAGRTALIADLAERGVGFDELAAAAGQPDADPFDLLCHLAFDAPLRTRRERAARLRAERRDFFERYGPEARAVLDLLLEKYAVHGTAQFVLPDVLRVPPLAGRGTVVEISRAFGGAERLRAAMAELQTLLYAA